MTISSLSPAETQPIEDHFDKSYEREYILQKAKKNRELKEIRIITDQTSYILQRADGLGDIIRYAEKHVSGDLFFLKDTITKSPTPCIKQLIDVYNKYNSSAISL